MPVKWLKILNEMLDYHPRRRITIKQLVNHRIFLDYFKENPYLLKLDDRTARPSNIHEIQINFPKDITWTAKRIRNYIILYADMRREFVEEKRIELMVLVKNLVNQTQIPLQIRIASIKARSSNERPTT
eukprot:TRINITY_DN11621_c0_g1_i1.p1 TRINITY_DN11621_c0_g1~~TRINITY_DN11621_c0_g1_i1.p1  ORF type:complete len:129 (+),score=5.52 TRINITY_DN11621_c0_g1_i1:64-450(+)